MLKKSKKGFTIVELVIVIGVIAILSAILIPTFVSLTANAEKARTQSDLANAYSMYAAEAADGVMDEYYTTNEDGKNVEIVLKDRLAVVLTKGTEHFEFSEEQNKWVTASGALANNVAQAASTYMKKDGGAFEAAAKTAAELSTFGGYTITYAAA